MDRDETVGGALRSFREALGMSQADLARAMQRRGVPGMYPQTILKIEKGGRSLKFHEAVALAEIFGVEMRDLWRPAPTVAADRQAAQAIRFTENMYNSSTEQLANLRDGRRRIRAALLLDLSAPLRAEAERALATLTQEAAVVQAAATLSDEEVEEGLETPRPLATPEEQERALTAGLARLPEGARARFVAGLRDEPPEIRAMVERAVAALTQSEEVPDGQHPEAP